MEVPGRKNVCGTLGGLDDVRAIVVWGHSALPASGIDLSLFRSLGKHLCALTARLCSRDLGFFLGKKPAFVNLLYGHM